MNETLCSALLRMLVLVTLLLGCVGVTSAQTQYVITNDDVVAPFPNSISFFSVEADGTLQLAQEVRIGGFGIGSGYFGAKRVVALDNADQQCAFGSEAFTGDIVGIAISSFAITGRASGSSTDAGTSNGIGLALNDSYLYASYTDSNTIGTFAIEPGCTLSFLNDTTVSGLQGGAINAMAVHGNMLLTTFTDGSIESFDISNGTPVANGDQQISTGTTNSAGATYPNSIDVTKDGHFALFGDTSSSVVVEVSDISSGKLTKTKVYKSAKGISSSDIMLSPDETVLYVVNTQGDSVMASFFNPNTGVLSGICKSPPIRGMVSSWSYLSSLGFMSQSGNGGGVYIAEFGSTSGIALVQVTISGRSCTLQEAVSSPFLTASGGLLSIATFPPRSF